MVSFLFHSKGNALFENQKSIIKNHLFLMVLFGEDVATGIVIWGTWEAQQPQPQGQQNQTGTGKATVWLPLATLRARGSSGPGRGTQNRKVPSP